jgi:hypothetical protein
MPLAPSFVAPEQESSGNGHGLSDRQGLSRRWLTCNNYHAIANDADDSEDHSGFDNGNSRTGY